VLGSIRDVLSKRLPFEYSQPLIFANLSRSRNSRNKGRTKISGFTVSLDFVLNSFIIQLLMANSKDLVCDVFQWTDS